MSDTIEPIEPPRKDDLATLAPVFRAPFEAWLAAVREKVQHVEFRTIETRRTEERQAWLYMQGREEPYLDRPEATWTMDSRHRWGLAADWIMVRPSGEAVWSVQSYKWIYRIVPPEPFGIRHIAPAEWMHVEHVFADELVEDAGRFGLVQH